ncbi:SH3 domain-containing protein 19 isoform X2 [Athalia rosae]|nr:SH3 domain-containing protein 19 isoform X2 [Athalia rosae]XP_012251132.1 SH3 domain-containing protein 19 isoform X2 [Athalia rosae]
MRIPTRAAPRPPASNLASSTNGMWGSSQYLNGSFSTQPPQKKKPPPRPPPPKFTNHQHRYERDEKPKKTARPTELITNIFGRKANKQVASASYTNRNSGSIALESSSAASGKISLIDLSPPGSPTFTTRSSSDGVSVDSFGSDGNSNRSVFTSSGNTSQTESGFEDDFDFFGGLSSQQLPPNDPWNLCSIQDPFSPQPTPSVKKSGKTVGNSDFYAFNNHYLTESQVPISPANSNTGTIMPTIIRAKPAKPPAPKLMQSSLAPIVTQFNVKPVPVKRTAVPYSEPVTLNVNDAWNNEVTDEPSPPMPSIPPPAPPPQYLAEANGAVGDSFQESYGIALYDFSASQPNDLSLKEGDFVVLLKAINEDWLEGRVGTRQGIFPANFIDVKVPLPGLSTNVVNALYTFNGETWEDLSFREGAKIKVFSKLSDDWLYGECDGRKGQFPTNYVDRVPSMLSR